MAPQGARHPLAPALPFTVSTIKTHILLPYTQPTPKPCVELTRLPLPLLLGVAKWCSLWHLAQARGEKITQN